MSDEQRKDETDEVEGHRATNMTDEPTSEGEDDVDAHMQRTGVARTDARVDVRKD